jgi:DNA-binding Lrp family transcriptional regulator
MGDFMKDTELKLICELIRNSRRSDRELAKLIGISQPTVSRIRTRLEKEGILDYTAIPNLIKLGFGIVAVVFGKRSFQKAPESHLQKAIDYAREHPNIIFGAAGQGLGFDRISISIHKDYSEYAKFAQETRTAWAGIMDVESFLIDLSSKDMVQPLSLKPFANWLKKEKELE